jgi:hypothetical protein
VRRRRGNSSRCRAEHSEQVVATFVEDDATREAAAILRRGV